MSPVRVVRVASYNVHRCVGWDGRKDEARVGAVLREIRPDVAGLQEVESRHGPRGEEGQLDHLAEATGMTAVPGYNLMTHRGRYGNGILTRYPVLEVRLHDLSHRRRERRGALDVLVDVDGTRMRLLTMHFGLSARERRVQVSRLVDELEREPPAALVVVSGDFNDWIPRSRLLHPLHDRFGVLPRLKTYPARRPLLPLDRMWVRPRAAVRTLGPHRSPLARLASDHLPIVATLEIPEG